MSWKKTEVDYLKQNYSIVGDLEAAKTIRRSPNAIRIKASRLGISNKLTFIRNNLELNKVEEQVVLGGLLGDLHCRYTNTSQNARLEGAHSEKQKDYLFWKADLLKRLMFTFRVTKENAYWYESKSFKILNKYHDLFYQSGKKRVALEVLNLLNDFGLLIWYLDDGSYSKRDKNIKFYTNGFSYEEQLVLKEWFRDNYWVSPAIRTARDPQNYPGKEWYYIHFSVQDSKKLLKIFSQFDIPPSMKYKLGKPYTPLLEIRNGAQGALTGS